MIKVRDTTYNIGAAILNAPINVLKGFLDWSLKPPPPRRKKKVVVDDDDSDADLAEKIKEQ